MPEENIKTSRINLGAIQDEDNNLEIIEDDGSLTEEVVAEEENVVEKEESQPTEETETPEETTEEATPEETTAVEEGKTAGNTEVDYESWAKENGYVSKDDFEDAKLEWQDEYKAPDAEYSPFLQGIIEAEKNGAKIDNPDYWKFQSEDVAATGQKALKDTKVGLDLLKDAMLLDDPDAPEADLIEELSLKYSDFLSGEYDPEDREYKVANAAYNRDVRKATKEVATFQKQSRLPQNPEVQQRAEAEAQAKIMEEIKPKAERQFKRRVSKHLEDNKTFSFKSGDDTIEYEMSKKEVAGLNTRLSSLIETIPQLITPDGLNSKPIEDGLLKTVTEEFMWNTPEIRDILISKVSDHKASLKAEESTKSLKNTQPPEANGSKVEQREISVLEQVAANLGKKRT